MTAPGIDALRHAARDDQAQLATADPPFAVIACPGAGKTRLIVDRHLHRSVPGRQGRAIASFTRVAAAEIHRRCASAVRLELVEHPHFIGTLDTFIWLHLVRPFLTDGTRWQRLESWRDAPASRREFVCGQKRYQLSDVNFAYDPVTGTWSGRPTGAAAWQPRPPGWEHAALATRRNLAADGYLTGDELRERACRNLATQGPRLVALLAAKYAELIVDEAQDCSTVDLQILDRLHRRGLPLILVADPDQAIYGFRGGSTTDLATLVTTLGPRTITSNWRSTTNICRAAATLRLGPPRPADTALGDHHAENTPILLYAEQRSRRDTTAIDFLTYANQKLDIPTSDCMIIAHARGGLPKGYAGPAAPPESKTAALAWAVGTLTEFPHVSAKIRDSARDTLLRSILRWWYPDADRQTPAETLTIHGLDPSSVDRLLHRALAAMPDLDQPAAAWAAAASQVLTSHPPTPAATRAGTRLTLTGTKNARSAAGLPTSVPQAGTPRLSTIHQVKGEAADAVLVYVPDTVLGTTTLDAWRSGRATGTTAEAVRVLYVAATRARRLLGFSLPADQRQPIADHLHRHGVAVELR
ncbi:ATP-dependent helicase [Longispora sp. NPDC051575]|uniref:ATP-dependent helicase n=1 Tax=Longispora sp. NPDC051575 TaxID=3154943 RepID=UPI003445AF3D